MRKLTAFAVLAAAIACVAASTAPARPPGTNGKIVTNAESLATGADQVYTVDPDGTDQRLVADNAEVGQWSPDGQRIAVISDSGEEQLLNPDTGNALDFGLPFALYPDLALFCNAWSPDGDRLACESFGQTDPSLNGVYTLRSSDGGDLQRVTSAQGEFADDCPADYSPNGKRLVITRFGDTGLSLDTVKTDGKDHVRLLSRMEINFCNGSWSPHGNEILFSAHVPDGSYHSSIWVVHADGSGLRQVPVPGCGGLRSDLTTFGCFNPVWSPDGKKIAFGRNRGNEQRDVYTVNADGSGLFQVTNTPDISEFNGDWGTHPLTP